MNNKFEEAYCSAKTRNVTVEEAKNLCEKNKVVFSAEYQNSFMCPECRKAKLSFVNAKTPYFRSYPNSEHDEDCSLQQDVMNNDEAELFLESRENEDKVKRQMDRLLRMLLTGEATSPLHPMNKKKAERKVPIRSIEKEITRTKLLPRKRIDIPFTEKDFNCDKLFYGTVKLKWEEAKEGNKKILLYHLTKHNLLCRIKVTQKVYNYINSEYKSEGSFDCAIVFAANFSNNTEKSYQITSLQYGQLLTLQKIE